MCRRPKLEANLANARSSPARRYLLYGAMIVMSLALPAVLTLRGNNHRPARPHLTTGYGDGAGAMGDGGGGGEVHDDARKPSSSSSSAAAAAARRGASSDDDKTTQSRSRGRKERTSPVSRLEWRGLADGIASAPASADDIHVVFSTDCSPFQNYQAIVLFHSAEVRERGGGGAASFFVFCPCSLT